MGKVYLEKKNPKAVEFPSEITAEHIALLLEAREDLFLEVYHESTNENDKLEDLQDLFSSSFDPEEFEALMSTEFGRGYLIGLGFTTLGFEELMDEETAEANDIFS